MKVCLGCTEKLLDAAAKCPKCGVKAKDFPIFDALDTDGIQHAIESIRAKDGTYPEVNPTFWNRLSADADRLSAEKRSDAHALKNRIAQMDKEGIAYCPKCYSTSLSANKRGWKVTTGLLGSSKVIVTCLKCGHKFKPGNK